VFDLDVSASEISDAVTRLRRSFDGHGLRLGIDPKRPWKVKLDYVNELAMRLLPFAPVLDDVDVVCFFAHGALHHFPFHAAHVDRDEPLIARCAVTYGLSRRLLALARARSGHSATAPRPRSALVVGVPSIGEPRPELFLGDDAFLRSFGIEAAAPSCPGETQVEDVLRAMTSVDLLHFNCHGMFSASRPLDSALLLSDGTGGPRRGWDEGSDETVKHLSARRLFGTNTVARTAILRACSSGATNVRVGDEQEGILRALFYAGLSSCVVARWKIDTESSRVLIRAMYDEWLRPETDVPLAQALRRAMLRLLTQPEADHYRHPYHWAPFSLVGDWR
jgi:CHAT domain-containing protein